MVKRAVTATTATADAALSMAWLSDHPIPGCRVDIIIHPLPERLVMKSLKISWSRHRSDTLARRLNNQPD